MATDTVVQETTDASSGAGQFDLGELLQRFRGKREFVCKLLTLFGQDLPNYRAAIEKAHLDGDMVKLRAAAHTLKGAALNVSAGKLGKLASQLEQLALHEKRDSIGEAVDCLGQILENVIAEVPRTADEIRHAR